MKSNYIAYIDEAGDEGFGKLKVPGTSGGQSRWLGLGGFLVRAENDKHLPKWRDEILIKLNRNQKRDLHFRELKHAQKVVACETLKRKQFGMCVIMSNKVTLNEHPKKEIFKQKQHLYNYLCRFLLERLTSACVKNAELRQQEHCSLKIVFSRRAGTDYQEMTKYLTLMRDGKEKIRPVRSINWDTLNIPEIEVINHSKSAGLQLADVITSAAFHSLEPNAYGNYEPRYTNILMSKFIKDNKGILDCGFTLIPPLKKCPLDNEQKAFISSLIGK